MRSISLTRFFSYILVLSAVLASSALAEKVSREGQNENTSMAIWEIYSAEQWQQSADANKGFEFVDGRAEPQGDTASYRSKVQKFSTKRSLNSLVVEQVADWRNWQQVDSVGPSNLQDAPVFLARGEGDYWLFGRYGQADKRKAFKTEPVAVEGFSEPLVTTPFEKQYDAPGGLKPSLGGYHAWQSRDMENWVHHGPVSEQFSRWVTTAEMVDGKLYLYYDYPNDQDPHLYIDDDLTDGVPGENIGMAFLDPSHGSDCAVIRDLEGGFHVIYEDWSPINARKHSWDSPLAGLASGVKGFGDFEIRAPAVDHRTKPTGETATYLHPHWKKDHPEWDSNVAEFQVHEPEQNAYGDWAAIAIGGQYYLFCDYHPANDKIRIAWFTSSSLDKQFEFCGEIGAGHPDPDIGFAEGKFYLINQTKHDYVSSGPWVGDVEVRVGVDTTGDGEVDHWSKWQTIAESYESIPGFSKQIKRVPAAFDVAELPQGFGFAFELKVKDATAHAAKPILDSVTLKFAE